MKPTPEEIEAAIARIDALPKPLHVHLGPLAEAMAKDGITLALALRALRDAQPRTWSAEQAQSILPGLYRRGEYRKDGSLYWFGPRTMIHSDWIPTFIQQVAATNGRAPVFYGPYPQPPETL